MTWVSDFFTKNPNLKNKRKKNSVFGGGVLVSDFFTKNPNLYIFGGGEWKG